MLGASYERLSRFAGNLANCLSAGLGLPQSLEMGVSR